TIPMPDNFSDSSQSGDTAVFVEYQGAAFFNNVFYAIWADNSNNLEGPAQVFFDKVTIDPGLITTGSTGGAGGGPGSRDHLYEPNNTSSRAYNLGTITPPSFTYGLSISVTDNQDWYKFKFSTVDPCVEINEMVGVGQLFLRLYRRNPNGTLTLIDQSSNPGSGASQEVHLSVTNPNTVYFLQVYGFNTRPETIDWRSCRKAGISQLSVVSW